MRSCSCFYPHPSSMLVFTGSGKSKGPGREAPYARGQFLPTHSSASLLKDTGLWSINIGLETEVWGVQYIEGPWGWHGLPLRSCQQQKGVGMIQAHALKGQTLHVNEPGLARPTKNCLEMLCIVLSAFVSWFFLLLLLFCFIFAKNKDSSESTC